MSAWLQKNLRYVYVVGSGILVFLIYLPTIIPDLTWYAFSGDGGELITAAVTLGIPHPPGYPTYILLGKLFSHLPFEPVAYRFHLLSALCAATAAGFITATAQQLIAPSTSKHQLSLSTIPAFVFAFSPLVGNQAIVAEVYTLNLAVVAAFLWALLGKRPSSLCGFLFGLSLTTHLTSFLLLPLTLIIIPWRQWWRFLGGTLLGLSPFLLLPYLAQQGSPVIWGDPSTINGWWWIVSAQIYQPNQFGLPFSGVWPKFVKWAGIMILQLGIFGWPLLLYSGWALRNGRFSQKRSWWLLVGTAVLYLIYAFFYNTSDSIVLTLPALLILSLCLMVALKALGKWRALLPAVALLLHLSSYIGANIHNIRLSAEQIFDRVPPDAILITSGDPDIFALWYFHHVEEQRPDIILVDDKLFAFDWYRQNLKQLYPDLRTLAEDNLVAFQKANEQVRPYCRVSFQPESDSLINVECSGEKVKWQVKQQK